MPIYIIFALVAAFCFSLNAICSKLVSKYFVTDRNSFIFYYFLSQLLFLPFLFFLTKISFPKDGFIYIILFALTFFIGNFFITTVLFRFDISVLHPLFNFQTIFSVLFAYLFLNEVFPTTSYFFILVIVIGGILVGMDEKFKFTTFFSKNFLIFLCGIFFYALSDMFTKKSTEFMDVYNVKFWSLLTLFLMSLTFLPSNKNRIKLVSKKFSAVILANLFAFIASIFIIKAFSYNITISAPIIEFGGLFTLIISAVLSRFKPEFLEHHPMKIYILRGVGLILMLCSAIMLSRV